MMKAFGNFDVRCADNGHKVFAISGPVSGIKKNVPFSAPFDFI